MLLSLCSYTEVSSSGNHPFRARRITGEVNPSLDQDAHLFPNAKRTRSEYSQPVLAKLPTITQPKDEGKR